MSKSLSPRVALLASALLMTRLAGAHHSFAMFDGNRVVVLRGAMLSLSFLNPHTWISIVVPAGTDAAEGRWDIEATSTGMLAAQGIHGDTFKVGDKLTVGIRPLKDGRRGGSLVFVVDSSGKAYGANPETLGFKIEDMKP